MKKNKIKLMTIVIALCFLYGCGMIPGASYLGLSKEFIPKDGLTSGQRVCLYSRSGFGTKQGISRDGISLFDGDKGTVIGGGRTICSGFEYTYVIVKFDKGVTLHFGNLLDKWALMTEDNGYGCTSKSASLQKCN